MDATITSILSDLNIDEPWGLIEAFAAQPREAPDDANRGAEMIAERLRGYGVPTSSNTSR